MVLEGGGDLLNVVNVDAIACCLNSKAEMNVGIAKKIADKYPDLDAKLQYLVNIDNGLRVGGIVYEEIDYNSDSRLDFIGLVNKRERYDDATYEDLEICLKSMKQFAIDSNLKTIAIPQIACGRDGLDWALVKGLLKDIFNDKDIIIIVCIYFEE